MATKPEIIRVWGIADDIQLVFNKSERGNSWTTTIPPDLSDGQYAAEIFAEDEAGSRALWSGILYMHNGKVCLHLDKPKYIVWVLPITSIKPKFDNNITDISITFEGVCCHD